MKLKLQLLKKHVSYLVEKNFRDLEIDADHIADSRAIMTLSQIHRFIYRKEEYTDSEMIEEIRKVFDDNMLDIMEDYEKSPLD